MTGRHVARPADGGVGCEERTTADPRPGPSPDFLALLAHRLRTPLAAITAWAAVLKSASDPSRVAHAAAVIDANARKQAQLIDVCIDAMRVLSGSAVAERSPVSIVRVIIAAVHACRGKDGAGDIAVFWDGPDDLYWVLGDRRRLGLMVSLIIAHMVESMGEADADIDVTVRHAFPWIVLEVEATTRVHGVSAVQSRHGLSSEDSPDASDLRLAIVEQLIDTHGGRLERSTRSTEAGDFVYRCAAKIPAKGSVSW